MQWTRAVGGQQVTEIQRERWIINSIAVGVAGRKRDVAPALVLGRLKEKKIDSVGRRRAVVDSVRRFCGNRDVAAECGCQIMIGHAVLEKVLQHGRDRGDRERSAHRVPSLRDLR